MRIRIQNTEKQMAKIVATQLLIVATQLLAVATQLLTVAAQLLTGKQTERIYLWESWLPNADGTIESPSPEGNPLTQIAEHHIPLHLSLTGNLMSSHNFPLLVQRCNCTTAGLGYLEVLELSMRILLLGQLASVRTINSQSGRRIQFLY
jgi:hypothetical protein